MKKKYNIFFGAAGAGKAYSEHTSITPDYYIDNDKEKWGFKLNGVEIKSPNFLTNEIIKEFFFFFLLDIVDEGIDNITEQIFKEKELGDTIELSDMELNKEKKDCQDCLDCSDCSDCTNCTDCTNSTDSTVVFNRLDKTMPHPSDSEEMKYIN